MHIADLNGKKICILGFGREGQSVLRNIRKYAPEAKITIADQNENINIEDVNIHTQIGTDWLANLVAFDVIITSPGVPPFPELQAVSDTITNATHLFIDTIANTGATLIGVTGSKGKSTVSSLITAMLRASGKNVHLVGNIGFPVLDFIEKAGPDVYFVQEMSSYQLMYVSTSPHIAVVTSFFPDHLDYHGSLEEYLAAKKRIASFQKSDDHIFYAADTEGAKQIAQTSQGFKHPYSEFDSPVSIEQTKLIGTHNLRNIGGAWLVAEHVGVDEPAAITAICNFVGLPHRLENIGIHHGIEWIDDAISTTPESAIAALEALGNKVETLICGGQDRGYNFKELGKIIDETNIKHVILFPDSGSKIRDAINSKNMQFIGASDMQQAVSIAKDVTSPGKTCLLSTASPSYNMFKNFEAKGDEFQAEARK